MKRFQDQLRPILTQALESAAPADRAYIQLVAFKTQMIAVDFDDAWRSYDALEAMGETVPDSYLQNLKKHPRH